MGSLYENENSIFKFTVTFPTRKFKMQNSSNRWEGSLFITHESIKLSNMWYVAASWRDHGMSWSFDSGVARLVQWKATLGSRDKIKLAQIECIFEKH